MRVEIQKKSSKPRKICMFGTYQQQLGAMERDGFVRIPTKQGWWKQGFIKGFLENEWWNFIN